jgi:hypothetical protein
LQGYKRGQSGWKKEKKKKDKKIITSPVIEERISRDGKGIRLRKGP